MVTENAANQMGTVIEGSQMGTGIGLMPGFDSMTILVVSLVVALVIAIVLWVLVLPEKRRPKLSKFFTFLADIFNFRSLLIEKILKFTYLFFTFFAIIFGFCMLFIKMYGESMALYGVLIMILGPVVLRLIYELSMLGLILVKNVIEINNKIHMECETEEQDEDVEIE